MPFCEIKESKKQSLKLHSMLYQAISALRAFGNNIEIAISWLLRQEGQNAAAPIPDGEGEAAMERAGNDCADAFHDFFTKTQ